MRKVIFSSTIPKISIDNLPEDTLVIVHEMYDKPCIDRLTVEWQKFKAAYSEYETSQYVVVGANRMISPSNRCDMVNDFMQVMTKTIPKISIDTAPFIGEPWRLWYHYSLVFGEWLGVDYSYPVEGEWKKWFYYDENTCRLSGENLPLFIKNTESDLIRLTTEFLFYVPNEMDTEYYEETKKIIFEKFDTPKLLTNMLLKYCNKHFGLDIDFDSYLSNKSYKVPDFGVYRYLVEENKRRMNIYNCFTHENL
ncbi:hypothetical protein EZS27_003568 [termite gut metagenome]|uniref:Uncharacterized protein n=1 Tax=termite gut metagenome TaxID=433724 RepID=A0A5J4SSQ4_9ZZZZ